MKSIYHCCFSPVILEMKSYLSLSERFPGMSSELQWITPASFSPNIRFMEVVTGYRMEKLLSFSC